MDEPRHRWKLALGALGIVYGDIGTSPIYAFRECFKGEHGIAPTPVHVIGVLSLIVWSLLLIVSVKYLVFVMRADNKGEGGIIALTALLNPWRSKRGSSRYVLMLLGLFGGALLYGDGTLTPAISVLSAVEGLSVAAPSLSRWVLPITLMILIGLFNIQSKGTGKIGIVFGPVLCLWFVVLAVMGVVQIFQQPMVLAAFNPIFGMQFLLNNGVAGYVLLGAVFLVVTGGEALYADMGHFGPESIRLAWFSLVLPALLLNYFGQGALILRTPEAASDPFYLMAPTWGLLPLVIGATLATIIASQAVISGTFSLTRQLVQLRQLPRLSIVQTSDEHGQIYIPFINWLLMWATIGLVLGFKSSSAMASAYGIAVSTTMVITTILAFFVARRYKWSPLFAGLLTALFVVIDVAFFGANLVKIADGGWYPIGIALFAFMIMTTWARGGTLLSSHLEEFALHFEELNDLIAEIKPFRIPGTAVFMSSNRHRLSPHFVRFLQRNKVLQNNVVLLTVETRDEPRIPASERVHAYSLAPHIIRVTLRYGFMQQPHVPIGLRVCRELGLDIDLSNITYYIGRETLIPSRVVAGMNIYRERIFAFLSRNAMRPTTFYSLPVEDVIELGFQVEI